MQNSCLIEELDSGDCILENEIVKTQWINNIIYLSETNYIYINMVTTKNDDLIIVMSSFSDYPTSNVRVFYGLNNEGRGYFKQNNEESKIFTNTVSGSTISRNESEIFMVKLESLSETKEYIFEYGKSVQKIQIYDIEDGFIYKQDFSTAFHYLQNIIQIMRAKVILS